MAESLRSGDIQLGLTVALGEECSRLMGRNPDRSNATSYDKVLPVSVERPKALFSSWYEMFPRSCDSERAGPATFNDCAKHLSDIARMGFDVLYLPPIHPIGESRRKGKDNVPRAHAGDPGSPWAIGSREGGHKSVDPSLGSLEDFVNFVQSAGRLGIEVALDLALQCSHDHPYVKEHPEWFRRRPDGTIQYAENPPKKYEDIVPFDFETEAWQELWNELKSVVEFWITHGIRIFRVDNPHTKPFTFWEWLIAEIKKEQPDVLFLSEAFTRPRVMYRLAKLGFSQSYTYFTWRNTKSELEKYLRELTRSEVREFFRPNFWPNTPDILPEYLQYGGRPAFIIRFVLAATLSSNYGIYGPPFELWLNEALPGKEEYRGSEKYEIKRWKRDAPDNLRDLITRMNRVRRENQALQTMWNLRFCETDNDHLLFFVKRSEDGSNTVLVVVNLDPHHIQSGWLQVPIDELGISENQSYMVRDLISDDRFIWQGRRNYVELDPSGMPAHVFELRRRLRREVDFDYYM
jgi:starch synthase (maltosyl-transferring)